MASLALFEKKIDCAGIDIAHFIEVAYAFKAVEIDSVSMKLLQLFLKNIRESWVDELEKTGCNVAAIGRMCLTIFAQEAFCFAFVVRIGCVEKVHPLADCFIGDFCSKFLIESVNATCVSDGHSFCPQTKPR